MTEIRRPKKNDSIERESRIQFIRFPPETPGANGIQESLLPLSPDPRRSIEHSVVNLRPPLSLAALLALEVAYYRDDAELNLSLSCVRTYL